MPSPSASSLIPEQRREASLPVAIEETTAGVADGRLVVAGGLDALGRDRAEVWVLSGGSWQPGPSLPWAVDHAAAATIAGTLYVVGGFSHGAPRTDAAAWDGRQAWTLIPALPQSRGALALVSTGTMLVAAGGRGASGVEVAAVQTWSPGDLAWRQLGLLPMPRDHVAGFLSNGLACFAGGRSPTTARVDCVNPANGTWSTLPLLPAATSGAGAATVAEIPLIGGGEVASETGTVAADLWWLSGGSWRGVPMLLPRHGWEGAVLVGRLWACGGGVEPGLHPSSACTSIGVG